MKLIDQIKAHRRHDAARVDQFALTDTHVGVLDVDIERSHLPSFTQRYRLYVTLGTEFDALPATYSTAQEVAQRRLVTYLYGDVIARLDDIEQLVLGGNREQALVMLGKLRRELTGG
jgi:hypothetical protein